MTTQPYQHTWTYSLSVLMLFFIIKNHGLCAKNDNDPPEKLPFTSWDYTFKKQFPVAIISGKLEAYDSDENNHPVKLRLEVIDQLSKAKQKWIYNPSLKGGGDYKMFLRPNRTYEINIIPLKEGYKKHKIQIYIPRSTYTYEFSRKLRLESLRSVSGKVIATKISVMESFHKFTDTREVPNSSAYYDGLIQMTNAAFERADSTHFSRLIHAGYIPDTTNYPIKTRATVSNPKYDNLIHTIESAISKGDRKPLDSLMEISELLNSAYVSEKLLKKQSLMRSESFHFDRGSILIAPKYASRLKEIAKIFKDHDKKLILEINGYSDSKGSPEQNEILSKQRATSILRKLKDYQVTREDFILILNGFGEIKAESPDKARRADVNIYKLE